MHLHCLRVANQVHTTALTNFACRAAVKWLTAMNGGTRLGLEPQGYPPARWNPAATSARLWGSLSPTHSSHLVWAMASCLPRRAATTQES